MNWKWFALVTCSLAGLSGAFTVGLRMNWKWLALVTCSLAGLAGAQDKPEAPPGHKPPGAPTEAHGAGPKAEKPNNEKETAEKKERQSVTKHSITLHGEKIDYTATAGTLPLKDKEGKVTAEIFYIAYTKDGVTDPTTRTLTFSFNGGPGSSSVWMHMGLLGPKRVKLQSNGFAVPPPYTLVDNDFSMLDESDLVFIDPVGTGYSRATKPDEAKKFYGVKEDAQSVGEFIRLYVTRHDRWLSPKFLIGESYGTTRAAALSQELLETHRMSLNGVMFLSSVLSFQTIFGGGGNELPLVLYVPSYTATAWYHKKLAPELLAKPLTEVLKESETFTAGELNRALLLGDALSKEERAATVKHYARLTGLSETYVEQSDLRVPLPRFAAELLRDQKLVLGRFDGRYTSFVRSPISEYAERDPSADGVFTAFAATFNDYVRKDLKYEEDESYLILAPVGPWDWGAENKFANVSDALAEAMTSNPFLKVHVSCGYYDLATPYFAAQYQFHHLQIHPDLAANITIDHYTAGHMMYLNLPDLQKQKQDLARFIRGAEPAK